MIAIVFLVALVITMKKAGYIQSQGEKEALKQAERMRLEREYGYIPSIWSDIRDFFSDSQTRELRNIRRELQKMNNNK